jgi:hypothetical protein
MPRRKYATVLEAQEGRRRQNRERMHRQAWAHLSDREYRERFCGERIVPVHQVIPTIPPPPKGVLALTMASLPLR